MASGKDTPFASRIEKWNGFEVVQFDRYETYFYLHHVVKSLFALGTEDAEKFPRVGYFFCDDSGKRDLLDPFGGFAPNASEGRGHDALHAIRIEIPDVGVPDNFTDLPRPRFESGVIDNDALATFKTGFVFVGIHKPLLIPHWQAELWENCGLKTPPSYEMIARLKEPRTDSFTPIRDVTSILTSTQKLFLVITMLYGCWEEQNTSLGDRVWHLLRMKLLESLTPQNLQNYCAEAGVRPMARSQFLRRLESIVKKSRAHYSRDPNSKFDAERSNDPPRIFYVPGSESAPPILDAERYKADQKNKRRQQSNG
jgi:hypothetical protein